MRPNPSHERGPSTVQAYNLLLEGDFFSQRNTKPDTEHAIGLYKNAIALDPNYARAWARLSVAYGALGWFGLANVEGQRDAIAQALRADPESPETFARCKLDLSERETHPEALAHFAPGQSSIGAEALHLPVVGPGGIE